MSLEVQVDSSVQAAASDCLGDMDLVAASHDPDHIHAVGEHLGHLGQEVIGPSLLDFVGRGFGLEEGVFGRPEGQQAPEVILISSAPSPFGVVAIQEIGVEWRCRGLSVLHESGFH